MFDKSWLFAHGGRPVIYQPDADFLELPEALRWRHVRYELGGPPDTDFTWEREWRLRCDELVFDSLDATVILPGQRWLDLLLNIHKAKQDWVVEAYSTMVDRFIAETARDPFKWKVAILG